MNGAGGHRRGGGSGSRGGEVILEITQNGAYLKVTAIDPQTGLEASAIGPATQNGATALRGLAIRKLERLLMQRR